MLRKGLAAVCILNILSTSGYAVTLTDLTTEAQNQLAADSTLLSGWMSNQLKNAIPFNSTAGNVVPSQLKIFGIEVGAEGVVSGTKMDVDGLRALPTQIIDTNSIDTFSRLPMPMVLGHAKIGLPFGFDAGIRVGGIPKTTEDSGSTKGTIKNKVVGLDLRKKIIDEGMLKPFGLTLGLNYTHADGSLDITNTYGSKTFSAEGQEVDVNNGLSTEHADWKTNSVGAQIILDKKIFIITPYIGASANHNSGDINNSITTTGTATAPAFPTLSQDITAIGSSTSKANKWDVRGLVGFELSVLPFVKLGLQGEYGGSKNSAGALGLRVQFR